MKSYIRGHLRETHHAEDVLEFIIELCAQRTVLARTHFVSRHSSNKSYTATVQFNVDTE